MSSFQSVSNLLSARQTPVKIFFRNDDGGWADDRLQALAREFITLDLPLDIAVIPEALPDNSVDVIGTLLNASDKISIHQHGFAHTNHQVSGRSCEFGSDRNYEQQFQDIASGQEKLAAVFGSRVDSIFTPPWNRCTDDTVAALKALGVEYLSRIIGSTPIDNAVPEISVSVDWLKKHKGVRLSTVELTEYICGLLNRGDEVMGIMLHHEHMDQKNRQTLHQLIDTLRQSPLVSFHSMLEAA